MRFLNARSVRNFNFMRSTGPLQERIRAGVQQACAQAGVENDDINTSQLRKEDVMIEVPALQANQSGLVRVIGAMDSCDGRLQRHYKIRGQVRAQARFGQVAALLPLPDRQEDRVVWSFVSL